jgi:hypothetical protein
MRQPHARRRSTPRAARAAHPTRARRAVPRRARTLNGDRSRGTLRPKAPASRARDARLRSERTQDAPAASLGRAAARRAVQVADRDEQRQPPRASWRALFTPVGDRLRPRRQDACKRRTRDVRPRCRHAPGFVCRCARGRARGRRARRSSRPIVCGSVVGTLASTRGAAARPTRIRLRGVWWSRFEGLDVGRGGALSSGPKGGRVAGSDRKTTTAMGEAPEREALQGAPLLARCHCAVRPAAVGPQPAGSRDVGRFRTWRSRC